MILFSLFLADMHRNPLKVQKESDGFLVYILGSS